MTAKYIKRTARAEQSLRNGAGSPQEHDLIKALAQPLPYQALQNMFSNMPMFESLVTSLVRRQWLEWDEEERLDQDFQTTSVVGYLPPSVEEVEKSLDVFMELMSKK